ncbi:MAG TPA: hypothetical protein VNA28_08280 [Solirubrobacteraceae bacterium]|nr:hypothetical protein [Solirubrobacteraceae bacterium]
MAGCPRFLVVLFVLAAAVATTFVLPAPADAAVTPRLDSAVAFQSQFARRHTVFRRLVVKPVHAASSIRVSCTGTGCPFKVRNRKIVTMKPSYSLMSLMRRAKLRPRTVVEVRMTKPNMIGRVVRFKIRASASPTVTRLCQLPGARRPSACTSTKPDPTATPTTTDATHTSAPAASTTPSPYATPPSVDRLRFGVYPWGVAGCVEQCAPSVAENADRSMAAVKQLKGSRSFVVHVYGEYDGVSSASADSLLSEASWWSSNGLKVAAVLRYRPADASKAAGYSAWIRTQTRRLAALSGTISIQVGNEPNNSAAGAGDGSYPGVIGAIAAAVPAARAEVVAAGRPEVLIGFNWAAGASPATTEPMWAQLKQAGGSSFTQAVGFVGVNVYPGTWSPPLTTSAITGLQVEATMRGALDAARNKHMVAAGVAGAAIVIGETGYPTTAARPPLVQDLVLRAIIGVAEATKSIYGVTGVYWFSLRDGNTASGQLENGYGLLRDDYTPKPAFATLQGLVASLGA